MQTQSVSNSGFMQLQSGFAQPQSGYLQIQSCFKQLQSSFRSLYTGSKQQQHFVLGAPSKYSLLQHHSGNFMSQSGKEKLDRPKHGLEHSGKLKVGNLSQKSGLVQLNFGILQLQCDLQKLQSGKLQLQRD